MWVTANATPLLQGRGHGGTENTEMDDNLEPYGCYSGICATCWGLPPECEDLGVGSSPRKGVSQEPGCGGAVRHTGRWTWSVAGSLSPGLTARRAPSLGAGGKPHRSHRHAAGPTQAKKIRSPSNPVQPCLTPLCFAASCFTDVALLTTDGKTFEQQKDDNSPYRSARFPETTWK